MRIDRGKDFLSRAVASVLAGFAVATGPLPGYAPHLKGSVETRPAHRGGQRRRAGAAYLFESNWKKPYSERGVRKIEPVLG